MPVRIPDNLPAAGILESENIFVMSETRAANQDIRPMKVLILNLMPNKIETETQLLRLLGNTPLQVHVDLLRIHDKVSKHTSIDHMDNFYRDFEAVRHNNYDGLIITGAPLGQIAFEEVSYWDIFAKSSTGHSNMSPQYCFFAGQPMRPYITCMDWSVSYCPLSAQGYLVINAVASITRCCAALMKSSTRRILALPKWKSVS